MIEGVKLGTPGTVVVLQETPTETTGVMIHAYSKYTAKRIFKDAFHCLVSEINKSVVAT